MISFPGKLYSVSTYFPECALSCWHCIASSSSSSWVLPTARNWGRPGIQEKQPTMLGKQTPSSYLICTPCAGGVALSRSFQEPGKEVSWEVSNIVPEVKTLSIQLSPGAANLAVLPGAQDMKGSGMPVDQVCEVKELIPLADGPTPGNPKESAHWQQQCCCSVRLQYT